MPKNWSTTTAIGGAILALLLLGIIVTLKVRPPAGAGNTSEPISEGTADVMVKANDDVMPLPISLIVDETEHNTVTVSVQVNAIGTFQTTCLLGSLVPHYDAISGRLGTTHGSQTRPRDVGTVLEILMVCDRALADSDSTGEQEYRFLRGVLTSWFAAEERRWRWSPTLTLWPPSAEEIRHLSAAVTTYYKNVEPREVHHQVPRLLLAYMMYFAKDWAGCAEALGVAVDQLPADDGMRLMAMRRLAECRSAMGDQRAAVELAERAWSTFGHFASLSGYAHELNLLRDIITPTN